MKRALLLLRKILLAYGTLVLALSLVYWVVPPVSTLMLARLFTLSGIAYESADLDDISRHALNAVVTAEDGHFCTHWGIDMSSMSHAATQAMRGKAKAGASTISMQVAKNLFLWPGRSYVRKAIEIPIALYLDLIWSKRRMMEVYLTVAEWGPGIYGIESAARHYFGKSAKQLTAYEAALLAAALPNPSKRNPARPSGTMASYAGSISANMKRGADLSCF